MIYDFSNCNKYTKEEIKKMPTRQLLKHLRELHTCDHGERCYRPEAETNWNKHDEYRKMLKAELSTREHIPSKKESKAIRKARIKKGV